VACRCRDRPGSPDREASRISRRITGTPEDAEVALVKLRVADHERRVHRPGTPARTARAALDAYLADV
jgi:hypothetical protein